MGYNKFIFKTRDSELLTGILSQFDFEAYSEEGNALAAWMDESVDQVELESEVREVAGSFFTEVTIEYIPDQNWNAEWESRFDPVGVDNFCYVRAAFHEPSDGYQYEVVIDPKQAFGTGHHETTYMMIESMRNIDFANKRVLDLGCGTGILAVLAAKLGSNQVTAVDIEDESVENTLENLTLNNTTASVRLGSVDVLKGETYDVILANINRNAIMFLIEDIVSLMNPGSTVLFSGFLEHNFEEVKDKADTFGLELQSRKQRGEWECLQFVLIKN